jgi:hypothetical protein
MPLGAVAQPEPAVVAVQRDVARNFGDVECLLLTIRAEISGHFQGGALGLLYLIHHPQYTAALLEGFEDSLPDNSSRVSGVTRQSLEAISFLFSGVLRLGFATFVGGQHAFLNQILLSGPRQGSRHAQDRNLKVSQEVLQG